MGPTRALPLATEEAASNGDRLASKTVALTPVELLRIAVSQNADIEKLKQLMDLQERWEKNEARKAFVVAMKQFKSDPPTISKNKRVHFETTKGPCDYNHATLDHVCNEVTKGLSAVGITHTWKVAQGKDLITVTCVLTHEFGHSEMTQLMGLPDNSGSKNAVQAIGSTVTYLQRYTLLAACGLAASNDTDGNAGMPGVETDVLEKNCGEMYRAKDIPELRFLFGVAYSKAEEINDRKAMAQYITVKDKRREELNHAPR
jgi:hypothetical protein